MLKNRDPPPIFHSPPLSVLYYRSLKPLAMAIELGKSLQISRTFNALSLHLDSGQMARTGKRIIVHSPRGIPRRSEAQRGIYGSFPSVDSSGLSAEFTNLGNLVPRAFPFWIGSDPIQKGKALGTRLQPWGRIYIERTMELKLNGIALNRSRNHIEDK